MIPKGINIFKIIKRINIIMILERINNRILHPYTHTHKYSTINSKENDEPIISTEYDHIVTMAKDN